MQIETSNVARGTPVTDRPLHGPLQVFRDAEVAELLEREMESPYVGERNAITLRKGNGLAVMRIALRVGGHLPSHRVQGPFSVMVLSGSVTLSAAGREEVLLPLDVAACDGGVEHAIVAREAAHVLVTIATKP